MYASVPITPDLTLYSCPDCAALVTFAGMPDHDMSHEAQAQELLDESRVRDLEDSVTELHAWFKGIRQAIGAE